MAISTDPRGYRADYAGVLILPRFLFWGFMGGLTALGWIMIL